MGSLMAGWNSPVLRNPDTVKLERTKSLTRGEIDSYWRRHRRLEVDVDFKFGSSEPPSPSFGSPSSFGSPKDSPRGGRSAFFSRSNESASVPESPAANGGGPGSNTAGDWWTRSEWAFLNEPPRDRFPQ